MSNQVRTNKIKSQRGGALDVFVNHKVKWPHEFVLSGQNKDSITYNQDQWIAGFWQTITIGEHMLDYVIDLPEDASDFSWALAKASHGEIKSWLETEKIDRIDTEYLLK